jgi:ribosome-associated toxin RatA of RatAB toxin-antitoxin module
MRYVTLQARVPAADLDACFSRISDFARYPELSDVVRSVAVHPVAPDGVEHSDWEVYFRSGILRWSEADRKDGQRHSISFEQTDGDFDSFTGSWSVGAADGQHEDGQHDESQHDERQYTVTFRAGFDFGIPSLAGILDPIAERVFKETIARVLAGLFGAVQVIGDPATARALAGAA